MSAVPMRPLAEYVALEHLLLGDLRELLEEPFDAENRRWMLMILDHLQSTLHCEFTLEEEDGYMSQVLDEHPEWSNRVASLEQQHQTLFAELLKLRQRLLRGLPPGRAAETLRGQLQDWMRALVEHQKSERELVFDSWCLDIGSED